MHDIGQYCKLYDWVVVSGSGDDLPNKHKLCNTHDLVKGIADAYAYM